MFIHRPYYVNKPISLNIIESLLLISKFLLIYLGFAFFASIIITIPIKILNLLPEHKILDLPLTFKVLFFIPFYEEIIFRLPLKYSKLNLCISIGMLTFLILYKHCNIYLSLSSSISFIILLYFITSNLKNIQIYFLKYYYLLFNFMAILFGMLHLSSFIDLKPIHIIISPLLVINQIFMGFILCYTRIQYKYGFVYCFLIHAFINMIFILPKNLL